MGSITVKGLDKLNEYLNKMKTYMKTGIKSTFDKIGLMNTQETKHRFETKTDPDGNKWLPLIAADYKAWKAKETGSDDDNVLVLTGNLRDSIQFYSTNKIVSVGTNVEYARIHEEGLSSYCEPIHRTLKVPKRQFLGFADVESERYIKLFIDDIEAL